MNVKSEKGAVTLVVLVTMLFLVSFLMSMYIRISNKAQSSAEATAEIAAKYARAGQDIIVAGEYQVIPIKTVEDLKLMCSGQTKMIDGEVYKFSADAYYAIQNDLDLECDEDNQWVPLPIYEDDEFTGVLDGLGHKITGLYIDGEDDYQGFFGTLTGTVKNIVIEQGHVKGNNYVGSIAALNNGTIINCKNTAEIIGNNYVTGGYFTSVTTNQIIDVWREDTVLSENAKFISGQSIAIIPKGFKVSADVLEQSINTGAVIQDINNNEFVWIPVPDINKMAVLQTGSDTNYRGVLYHSIISKTTYDWNEFSTEYREPDVITEATSGNDSASGNNYDASVSNLNAMNFLTANLEHDFNNDGIENAYDLKIYFQQNYNDMIASVIANGGFYVGRYEMSFDTIAESRKRKISAYNSTADNNWYRLYAKAKTYEKPGITSEMIWGSQFEAILLWLEQAGVQNIDQIPPTDVTGQICVKNIDSNRVTGEIESKDKLCNIYDLWGNSFEWTQEAQNVTYRGYRSASYNGEASLINRGFHVFAANDGRYATRITFYIN